MSYESRCGAQVFAQTGHYHGVVVRIKELKFSKKKDISRDVMKEMRILREIRHGNLNSFIGAYVEPMRILLITDYCAKGSLYVSNNFSFVLLILNLFFILSFFFFHRFPIDNEKLVIFRISLKMKILN